MKWAMWLSIIALFVVVAIIAANKTKRTMMIQTIHDRLGLSLDQLNKKTNDELIAMLNSMDKQ